MMCLYVVYTKSFSLTQTTFLNFSFVLNTPVSLEVPSLSTVDVLVWPVFAARDVRHMVGCLTASLASQVSTTPSSTVSVKNVSRNGQMSPREQYYPQLRTTDLNILQIYGSQHVQNQTHFPPQIFSLRKVNSMCEANLSSLL